VAFAKWLRAFFSSRRTSEPEGIQGLLVALKGRIAADYPVEDKLAAEQQAFLHHFLSLPNKPDSAVLGVIFYGSCLNPTTASKSSTPDYYVIVNNYNKFFEERRRGWMDRFFAAFFPPNIYRFEGSKYCVISLGDLKHETWLRALDLYHIGRFSKRVAIAWVKDAKSHQAIQECIAQAMFAATYYALALLPEKIGIILQDVIHAILHLSYRGDVRIEAMDKVEKIFNSEKDFYSRHYRWLLESLAAKLPWVKITPTPDWLLRADPIASVIRNAQWLLVRSRARAFCRWPKNALTVDKWVDYILLKIERTRGVRITISPHERRFILIYVWKYIWMLRKKNYLK